MINKEIVDKNTKNPHEALVYRIIDANCNRVREALRVIEEYFRFKPERASMALEVKTIRNRIKIIYSGSNPSKLLYYRDTKTDPFSNDTIEQELKRDGVCGVLTANFKRAQEACRVLEEYLKISSYSQYCVEAKQVRFSLYELEKRVLGNCHEE